MGKAVAVIGMGYWGKNLVRNFYQLDALKMVCDADADREKIITENYPGVAFTTSIDDVFSNPDIPAVAIATPAATHFALAKEAILSGKDVYVEKPLALSEKEGKELVDLAEKHHRLIMVGHILQYHPAVRKLKEMVRAGELGQLRYIYSNRLSMGKIRTEENILWSFAPHDISVILGLTGAEPERISCRGGAYLSENVADATLSVFNFPGGVRAHIFVSWLHPFKEQRLVVVGSEKMAVFEDTADDKLVVYPHRVEWKNNVPAAIKAEKTVVEIATEEPLKNECAHFISCVEKRETPLTDGVEGLNVLRVLNTCQESLEKGGEPLNLKVQEETAPAFFAHPQAMVHPSAEVGQGTKIWQFSHIMKNAKIGNHCVFGQNCSVEPDVIVGDGVKAQNNVTLYTGTIVEDYVFLGPSCVLTNVTNPRSEVNRHSLYENTILKRGCSIGANATIVCGITLGRYSFIGSGAVITKDVPDYALMVGVPAKQVGWVSRHGLPLKEKDAEDVYTCPESGLKYKEVEPGVLRCLDIDEEEPLPDHLRKGEQYYDDIVHGERLKA